MDESTLEFIYSEDGQPSVLTVSGKVVTMADATVLKFTQSFKVVGRVKGMDPMVKVGDVESIIEHYAILHTKLMIAN